MRQLFYNPVMARELRGRMRGARAFIIISTYLGVTAVVTLLIYLAVAGTSRSDLSAGRNIGQAIFWTVCGVALAQVYFITPSLTAGSVAGEKERQTYDLLITTLLSPWQIVIGKLVSALAFALLLIIAILPMASLAFVFGGVSGIELVLAIVGLFTTAVLHATLGLFWSTVMRTTLGATVMAQGSVLATFFGIPFLFVVLGTILFANTVTRDAWQSPIILYIAGIVFFCHPFIALGYADALLKQGENPFYSTYDVGNVSLLAPSPWLVYVVVSALLTLVLLLLTVRMLKPVNVEVARVKGKRKKVKEEVPSP